MSVNDKLLRNYELEGRFLRSELQNARRAKVPDLSEVRKYQAMSNQFRAMFDDFIIRRTLEIMEAARNEEILRLKNALDLNVIRNDSPPNSGPKGFCSPVKSDDVRRFEGLVKEVFGNDTEQCTTAWPY